jgi:hypothetical protein
MLPTCALIALRSIRHVCHISSRLIDGAPVIVVVAMRTDGVVVSRTTWTSGGGGGRIRLRATRGMSTLLLCVRQRSAAAAQSRPVWNVVDGRRRSGRIPPICTVGRRRPHGCQAVNWTLRQTTTGKRPTDQVTDR